MWPGQAQCAHLLSLSLSIISWSQAEKGLEQSRGLAWAAEWSWNQNLFSRHQCLPLSFPVWLGGHQSFVPSSSWADRGPDNISCCTDREESTSICHSWHQISFSRLGCLISPQRKTVPTGILCSPLHLSGWSQPRIQFVPFILLTKLKMTQPDTKRKGFPNTSCLISSTVHHTVNIFLLNLTKKILSHVCSSWAEEKAPQKTVWDWVRPKGTKGLWIPWKKPTVAVLYFPHWVLIYWCIHQCPKKQKSSCEKPLDTLMSKTHCHC